MRKTLKALLALSMIALVAWSILGCQRSTSAPNPTPQQSAEARAAAKAYSQLAQRCLPQSALGQLKEARSLATHSGRAQLAVNCGIPKSHRQAFEGEVLNAAEHAHLVHDKAARVQFVTVTLPQLIKENQG